MIRDKENKAVILFTIFILLVLIMVFLVWDLSKKKDLKAQVASLKDGKGKELLLSRCTTCHDLTKIMEKQRSQEEWKNVFLYMKKFYQMGPLTEEEENILAEFLAKN